MSLQAQATVGSEAAPRKAAGATGKVSNPIVSALYEMAVSVLGEQLREMFDKADDILFDSAEKARAGDEQRLYLDTMRIVRVQRAKIISAFQESLRAALSGIGQDEEDRSHLDDMSQWSLQDGDALEERIAVTSMESKAASLHAHELVELQRRLARLADLAGDGVSPESMAPARIIRAFQNSMRDLPVEFPIKLVIYKLFDRVVIARLSEVFVGANQLLAVHGIEPRIDGPSPPRKASESLGRSALQSAAGVPAWASGLDPSTFSAFAAPMSAAASSVGGAMNSPAAAQVSLPGMPAHWVGPPAAAMGSAYGDAMLAHEIAQILGAYAQGRVPQAPRWLPPQNVALVARMFDGFYRDARLPDHLKPMLARLQLPVMKAALADRRFFADPQHPARRTVNDLFEMLLQFGTAEAAPQPQMVNELQGLIDSVCKSFDLDPEKLRASQAEPVDERLADGFLREQEELRQKKNRARVERVRRIVSHELKRRIGERRLPPGVMRLMLSGFGPLLCLDYIRNGIDGASWTQTMQLVDRVIDSLQPRRGSTAERAAVEAEIVASISRRLANIGFSDSRLEELLSGLLQAYLDLADHDDEAVFESAETGQLRVSVPDAPPAASLALSPEKELQGLLSILLVPGGWFTVWEPAAQTKHWVRVKGYYPVQNAVMFGHYMEERFLRMRATAFATDLIEGRAAPIDPSPELQAAVARIAELPFERGSDVLVWTSVDGKPVEAQAPGRTSDARA
ncbi:DUF1631 family protein [Sinimarinibacterium thermocellulolyticum]|uniref:DUF1631 family protein n=1 Tax=Sinimarinibacterium thermocellulolyticum TaxID=3170016 RepID=A0ABV2AAY5_9GAMM